MEEPENDRQPGRAVQREQKRSDKIFQGVEGATQVYNERRDLVNAEIWRLILSGVVIATVIGVTTWVVFSRDPHVMIGRSILIVSGAAIIAGIAFRVVTAFSRR